MFFFAVSKSRLAFSKGTIAQSVNDGNERAKKARQKGNRKIIKYMSESIIIIIK